MANNRESIQAQLDELGSPDERLALYLALCDQLLLGTLMDENMIRLLAYAPELDEEVRPELVSSDQWSLIQGEIYRISAEIQEAGGNHVEVANRLMASGDVYGTFVTEQLRADINARDAGFIFSDLPAIIGGVLFALTPTIAASIASRVGGGAAAAGLLRPAATRVGSSILRGIGARAASGAVKHTLLRKIAWGTGIGLGTLAFFSRPFMQAMDRVFGPSAGGTQTEPTEPEGTTTTTAAPYQVPQLVPSLNQAPTPPSPASISGQGSANLSTDLGSDLNEWLQGDPTAMAAYAGAMYAMARPQEVWNPLVLGETEVSPTNFPLGISLAGQTFVPSEEYTGAAGTYPYSVSARPAATAVGGPAVQPMFERPEAQRFFSQEDVEAYRLGSTRIPPGAAITPQSTMMWGSRSLLQYANQYAQGNGVPVEIMYGIINRESGWNPYAVGDNGTSYGLAQIHLPEHPGISQEMASNPQYALAWTAQELKKNFGIYGTWEAAILAHRNPEGAQYLTQTGNFASAADREYVVNVATSAFQSGLGNTMFGGMNTLLANAGTGGSGRVVPPFVEPDRAKLRQWVKKAFEEVLLRGPTEKEIEASVGDLVGFYKDAYTESVKNYGGQTSREVDPESQFLELLEESGEGQYREDVATNRSMFEYFGDVAAILREGY